MRSRDQHPMRIHVEQNNDCAIVHVTGEVDMSNSRKLREKLLELFQKRNQKKVVVNLDGVPSMDSSGIATLMEGMHEAKKVDGEVILVGVHESLRGVLSLTGLLGVFDIRPTVEDALR
jgi:anti-anti-sigma factor